MVPRGPANDGGRVAQPLARLTALPFEAPAPGAAPGRLLIFVGAAPAACPKCGLAGRDQPACPRCGLAVARREAFRTTGDAAVPPAVRVAWQRVCAGWGVADHHDELLQLAVHHACYAWVAAQYRALDRTRSGGPLAGAHLDRLRRAAEVTLAVTATPRAERPVGVYGGVKAMLLILIIAIVASIVYARVAPVPAATPGAAEVR